MCKYSVHALQAAAPGKGCVWIQRHRAEGTHISDAELCLPVAILVLQRSSIPAAVTSGFLHVFDRLQMIPARTTEVTLHRKLNLWDPQTCSALMQEKDN